MRPGKKTALDTYIAKPDDSYSRELIREDKHPGYTEYLIDMDSQTWRDESQVDRPLWQHWLALIVPDKPCYKTVMLLISGGSNGHEAPKQAPKMLSDLVRETGCTVASLSMIPNQKLEFHGDAVNRSEDDLIGYTRDQYMQSGASKRGWTTWLGGALDSRVKAILPARDFILQASPYF